LISAKLDPACASVATALEHDPFYRAICVGQRDDAHRMAVLARYFDYSIQEGREIGRRAHLDDPTLGVAVWLLPQNNEIQSRAATRKRAFLMNTLSTEGFDNYYGMIDSMSAKSRDVVESTAWYLSIVAVAPAAQGRGLGCKLLEPTLIEADCERVTCYLETFSLRNLSFYERVGFATIARFTEPVTGADYALMVRPAR